LINEKIENCLGYLCKCLIPIRHEYYLGRGTTIAVCTLSSIKLLSEISNDTKFMDNIAIVGRLFSENKGIDIIIQYCIAKKSLAHLVVCGKEVSGHMAGDTLIALFKNGITSQGEIIAAKSPRPYLVSSYQDVETFRNRNLHNLVGETKFSRIKSYVERLI
jgi:tetrahydromethanopterin S-methyltransferase subunit A